MVLTDNLLCNVPNFRYFRSDTKKYLLKRWGQCRVDMDVSDGLKRCDSSQSDGKLPKGLYIDYIYR